jgi:hypothetical protein
MSNTTSGGNCDERHLDPHSFIWKFCCPSNGLEPYSDCTPSLKDGILLEVSPGARYVLTRSCKAPRDTKELQVKQTQ